MHGAGAPGQPSQHMPAQRHVCCGVPARVTHVVSAQEAAAAEELQVLCRLGRVHESVDQVLLELPLHAHDTTALYTARATSFDGRA